MKKKLQQQIEDMARQLKTIKQQLNNTKSKETVNTKSKETVNKKSKETVNTTKPERKCTKRGCSNIVTETFTSGRYNKQCRCVDLCISFLFNWSEEICSQEISSREQEGLNDVFVTFVLKIRRCVGTVKIHSRSTLCIIGRSIIFLQTASFRCDNPSEERVL